MSAPDLAEPFEDFKRKLHAELSRWACSAAWEAGCDAELPQLSVSVLPDMVDASKMTVTVDQPEIIISCGTDSVISICEKKTEASVAYALEVVRAITRGRIEESTRDLGLIRITRLQCFDNASNPVFWHTSFIPAQCSKRQHRRFAPYRPA